MSPLIARGLPVRASASYHFERATPARIKPPRRRTTMADSTSSDKLIDDLNAVIRDAETLLKATAAQTGETIQQARKRAEESVREAKERLAGVEEEALKRARAFADEADVF